MSVGVRGARVPRTHLVRHRDTAEMVVIVSAVRVWSHVREGSSQCAALLFEKVIFGY
jgi:hypothetical protein